MLEQDINNYLQWMISVGYSFSTRETYKKILNSLLFFVKDKEITWDDIFTLDTLRASQDRRPSTQINTVIKRFARYLFEQKKIRQPIQQKREPLPEIYEQYLIYYAKKRQANHIQIANSRRLLFALNDYLERLNINLSKIKIEHMDDFWSEFNTNLSLSTRRLYCSFLRGFLRYLYHERRVLSRDIAPLLVGAPIFAKAKPPRFLRPQEVKSLFAGLSQNLSSPIDLRTYAMLHLAYFLGFRPREISLIRLDDISFSRQELCINHRKNTNPLKLPLPEDTIKAIAAYIVGGRPKSEHRTLFLSLKAPFMPVTSGTVSH